MEILNFLLHPPVEVVVSSLSISLVLLFVVMPLVNKKVAERKKLENDMKAEEVTTDDI